MRHTVRRPLRGVEQAAAVGRSALRGQARTPGSGAASGATPARSALGTTRIPHKVPECGADSGP
ncbi:hypothetical protein EF913_26700 [Streptomyces sp. WAC04189]|nr:hypothetical protein DBP22_25170 [Streptomyces sp. CS207]QCB23121.1 hypothetical protein E5N77_15855 [Streptomyces sp. SS52]RIH61260.1 hypothetical protein D3C59_11060 [Streptomyces sp. SHP22-7]RSR98915.1 hypothetical protein EF913_26700 [Streptomyces sp. WAC04189]RSS10198.1 hypothetical protein EF915_29760 [Streptomyces sp. WAC08401]RSS23249.1 hypothetical protein EF914_10915 [Streptomyces sp. WAC05458]RSS29157.1 hypothetical protein EF916_12735 [Streptomyces sp. WAC08452]RSS63681.1 hypo